MSIYEKIYAGKSQKKNAQENQENLITWAFQKWIFC